MLHSNPKASLRRHTRFVLLGTLGLFSACVPVLGIDEPELASDTACRKFVCENEKCEYRATAAGTSCGAMNVCDGAGECKVNTGFPCSNATDCVSGICDTTCKLPTLSPCQNEQDCASGFCFDNSCRLFTGDPCADDAECWTNICHEMTCRVSDGSPCDESNECKSGNCATVCLTSDGATCTNDTECASGACSNGTCKVSHGNTCAADTECASGLCAGMACVAQSCIGLTSTCGPNGDEYCCASPVVTGGQYNRSNDPGAPATVSDFRLDRFEVTVGRFRKFVDAYPGSRPDLDDGQHPTIVGSSWNGDWDEFLPATQDALTDALANCLVPTWSASSANDELPINCVDWYIAFAFCAWDGGRLPTEAEWNYAAAGGAEQRIYPWSNPPSSGMIDASYAVHDCLADGSAGCLIGDIAFVGWTSPKGDGRWGHADLAGSVMEWTLDWYKAPYSPSCSDCANLMPGIDRVLRGGSWYSAPTELHTHLRAYSTPDLKDSNDYPSDEIGFRCARAVP